MFLGQPAHKALSLVAVTFKTSGKHFGVCQRDHVCLCLHRVRDASFRGTGGQKYGEFETFSAWPFTSETTMLPVYSQIALSVRVELCHSLEPS